MDLKYIPFRFPGIARVRAAFQVRGRRSPADPFSGGNISLDVGEDAAPVLERRKTLMRMLDVKEWVEMKQVHGDGLLFEPPAAGEPGDRPEADGQATSRPGRALVVKTADCQPLLLAHKSGGQVMALHVGWRGNVLGLPQKGVAAFCERYGLEPNDVMAVRGPSLSPQASEFVNFESEFGERFSRYFDPVSRTVDLWRLTRDQLASAGLRERDIFGLDLCTYSCPSLCFSYRRRKKSGRQASLIWIESI